MGKWVVVAIGAAILSFVAADLLGPQSVIFGSGQQVVGEIKGQKVTYPEFINEIERLKAVFYVNNQRTPNADELETVRQQAWGNFLRRIGYGAEYSKLGIVVTDDEMVDMVQGNNIHPAVINAFTDPNTGVFDITRLQGYLQNLSSLEPLYQQQWAEFERSLRPEREMNKLNALMSKTVYANKYDLEREHIKTGAKVSGTYLYVPYFSIADSTIDITDDIMDKILSERKEEFKLKDNIFFDYVSFSIAPSAEDSAYYREEMEEIQEEFATVEDDTSYIKLNSDESTLPTFYSPNALPPSISDTIAKMATGSTYGPIVESGNLVIYKLISKGTDSTGQYVKASHILIKTDDKEDAEAKRQANNVLNQARSGADFASLAVRFSEGPSSSNGGDLGWFGKGQMVAPFEEAAFSMDQPGLYPDLVKTQFGYHIIYVFESKSEENYLVGSITRTISPSDETRDMVYREADYFAGTSQTPETFESNAAEQGMTILKARNVGKNDLQINGIQNIGQVIRWGFSEADPGDISNVFELDDQYMVAVLTARQEEGYASVEDVEERLKPYALKRLKALDIKSRLEQLPEQGDLESMKDAFGDDAKIYNVNETSFSTYSLTGAGFDPAAVGVLFGLNGNSLSQVFEGENGVLIFRQDALTPAPSSDNLSANSVQFVSRYANYAPTGISEAIAEDADIEDNRYKFF